MKTSIVIPARLNSSRLPRKLLLDLGGKPVLRHTWERASIVPGVEEVVVAADSDEIVDAVRSWGGTAMLTPKDCPSGTVRIGSLLERLSGDFILNVQGDEPFIEPRLLGELIREAERTRCDIITAVNPIQDPDDLFNRNIVKAVLASDGRAIYFSRHPCPYVRDAKRSEWLQRTPFYRHIGVYGYTCETLGWYLRQPACELERAESLEQLRFIDHGWRFQTVRTEYSPTGIDTLEDLEKARRQLVEGADQPLHAPHYEVARATVYAEIEALETVLVRNRETLSRAVDLILSSSGKVVVTGLGKSGIIGHKISATLASTGTPSVFMNASEALHGDLGIVSGGDVVLMISNSAATEELVKMVPSLNRIGVRCIGMFGRTSTPLCKHVEIVLDIGVEREACPLNLAPMSSTTNTLVLGDAIAAAVMKARGFRDADFAVFHPGGTLGRKLLLTAADVMKPVSLAIKPTSTVREAIADVAASNLGACCVVDENNVLQGIITDGDFRRVLALENILERQCSEIMTPNPKVAYPDELVAELVERMEQCKTYVLPVVDRKSSHLVGLVRMHDVIG